MQYQLRMYTVKPGELEAFVAEWSAQIRPLRREFGFEVIGPWVHDAEDLFIWVLGFDGEFTIADSAYYDSDERKAMSPNPARHLQKTEHWPMRPVG